MPTDTPTPMPTGQPTPLPSPSPTVAALGWLVQGESSSWTVTSSPGAYSSCAADDNCDVTHAVDGTRADLTGRAFVFQAGTSPYDITIDMRSNVTLSRYQFYRSLISVTGAKTMMLQYSTDNGTSFHDIDSSTISMPCSSGATGGSCYSAEATGGSHYYGNDGAGGAWYGSHFETTTAAIWRVRINATYTVGLQSPIPSISPTLTPTTTHVSTPTTSLSGGLTPTSEPMPAPTSEFTIDDIDNLSGGTSMHMSGISTSWAEHVWDISTGVANSALQIGELYFRVTGSGSFTADVKLGSYLHPDYTSVLGTITAQTYTAVSSTQPPGESGSDYWLIADFGQQQIMTNGEGRLWAFFDTLSGSNGRKDVGSSAHTST